MVLIFRTYYNNSKLSKDVIIIKITFKARRLLGNNIAFYRTKKGWTQEQLAEKLGTSTVYLSNLENAKKNTRIDYIEHISNTLNI